MDPHTYLGRLESRPDTPLICATCKGPAQGNYSDADGPACDYCIGESNPCASCGEQPSALWGWNGEAYCKPCHAALEGPLVYLTPPNTRDRVQVIHGFSPVAEGTEAEMRAYFAHHYPTAPLVRFQDGAFHTLEKG